MPQAPRGQRRSRVLVLLSFLLGPLLSPLVIPFVEHSMDSLNPHTSTPAESGPDASGGDPRSL